MSGVAVITDTVSCLPVEVVSRYNIEVVPMEFIYEGKIYRDGIDITPVEFYQLLSTAKDLPTTSAPSPGTYLEVIKEVSERASDILIIAPSAKLTHAYESAKAAASMCVTEIKSVTIEVLDCGTAAGAQGLVVLAAAKEAARGKNLTEVLQAARDKMPVVHLIAFMETLHFLARSGRVPQVIAWANSVLNIKPIIELMPMGKGVKALDRVRTRPRAKERLLDILSKRAGQNPLQVIVMHSNALDEAEDLKNSIIASLKLSEAYVKDFTPVMGMHTGPGLLGIAYYIGNGQSLE